MDKTATQDAIKQTGLTGLLKYTDMLLQPAIQLKTTLVKDQKAEAALKPGTSKFGGIPDLPPEQDWPTWKNIPQSFIAQLRLADLQNYDVHHWLPQDGMLWFFYDARQETYGEDPQDVGGWQVFYRADTNNLKPATVPTNLPVSSRFKSSTVSVASELTLTQQPQLEVTNLKWSDDDQEKYDTVYEQFTDVENKTQPRHRIFGYPDTLQDDMRVQCQLMTNGITDANDPRAAQLSKGANDWQLLLQIDSDEAAGMQWANSGMLFYWIKLSDLQAHKFDHTWLVLQSE
ncbi:YwqG family protein [Dictyobacter arantiisoli]|uniref:DUF1963 domain-containing protein n=1 Tax=Dictyobacter arantiisoli TaxID=2014874 RepID=A0A5A5T7N9_9CHLR|nr:YwqG family protein [Dictyobacter arantiisoli]GCF06969.1 hypothetical protein KDI_05330 [Dictyobacter arantiisoli]